MLSKIDTQYGAFLRNDAYKDVGLILLRKGNEQQGRYYLNQAVSLHKSSMQTEQHKFYFFTPSLCNSLIDMGHEELAAEIMKNHTVSDDMTDQSISSLVYSKLPEYFDLTNYGDNPAVAAGLAQSGKFTQLYKLYLQQKTPRNKASFALNVIIGINTHKQ